MLHNFLQFFFNNGNKLFLLCGRSILCGNGKIRLCNAGFGIAVDLISDSRIHKGLLHRGTRIGTEHMHQHIHRNIQFPVKAASHRNIIGQIGLVFCNIIFHHGVFPLHASLLFKRLL